MSYQVMCRWRYPTGNLSAPYGPLIKEGEVERISVEQMADFLRPVLRGSWNICIPIRDWVEMMKDLMALPPEGGTVTIVYRSGILVEVKPK